MKTQKNPKFPDSTLPFQRLPKHVTLRRLRCTCNIADSQIYIPWTSFKSQVLQDTIAVPIRFHRTDLGRDLDGI